MAAAIYNLPLWGMQTMQRKYTALKLGHVPNAKTIGKLTVKFKDLGEDESTDSKNVNIEYRALKSCCNNASVVSVKVLMNKDHKRFVHIVVQCSLPMSKWHTNQIV